MTNMLTMLCSQYASIIQHMDVQLYQWTNMLYSLSKMNVEVGRQRGG